MPAVREQVVQLPFPIRGVWRAGDFADQPPLTTRDALNVRPRGVYTEGNRGGSRPGTVQVFTEQVGLPIRHLNRMSEFGVTPVSTYRDDFTGTVESADWSVYDEYFTNLMGRDGGIAYGQHTSGFAGSDLEALPAGKRGGTAMLASSVTDAIDWTKSVTITLQTRYLIQDGSYGSPTLHLMMTAASVTGEGELDPHLDTGVTVDFSQSSGGSNDNFTSSIVEWDDTDDPTEAAVATGASVFIGNDTYPQDIELKVAWRPDDGDFGTVYVYIQGVLNRSLALTLAHAGSRVSFEWSGEAGPTEVQIFDYFQIEYYAANSNAPAYVDRVVLESGLIFVEDDNQLNLSGSNEILDVDGNAILDTDGNAILDISNSDFPFRTELSDSVVRLNDCFYAEAGLRVQADDGILGSGGTVLTSVSTANFTNHSISTLWDAVEITANEPSVTSGTYSIAAVTANDIHLTTSAGTGSCTFRVMAYPKVFNIKTRQLEPWTASTAGDIPLGNHLCALYRDRIVLAGDRGQWFMSRQGDPFDWDFTQTDAQTAVAGVSSRIGLLPRPATALVSYTDSYLLFATLHQLFLMEGDPAYGGSFVPISEEAGVISNRAWCYSDDGHLFFLGLRGLYVLTPGSLGKPRNISQERIPVELTDINTMDTIPLLVYDTADHGVHIFLTSVADGQTDTHWFYHIETDSFWPFQFNATGVEGDYDPFSVLMFKTVDPTRTRMLMGCRDGLVRAFDISEKWDNEVAFFSSYVDYGPIHLGGSSFQDGLLDRMTGTTGSDSNDVTMAARVGATPEAAFNASAAKTFTLTNGINDHTLVRRRGRAAYVQVAGVNGADPKWEIGEVAITRKPMGRQRAS